MTTKTSPAPEDPGANPGGNPAASAAGSPAEQPRARPRGRPRRFDPDQAVATAQQLFRARGYDAVGVADITQALGINPPSFYAAFGSKAGLYARVLCRYSADEGVPLEKILRPGRPVAEALGAVLEDAARRYAAAPATLVRAGIPAATDPPTTDPGTADPGTAEPRAGCLALEGARCSDPEAREAARALTAAGADRIRRFVAETHPEAAERLTDYVVTLMAGLSTMAREGHSADRLLATARLAARALADAVPD